MIGQLEHDGFKFGHIQRLRNSWRTRSFRDENVDYFRKDKGSLYWLYRRLIDFRRKYVALTEGSYKSLKASGDLPLFCRELREERVLIALNMGPEPIAVSFPDGSLFGRVLLSSFLDREGEESAIREVAAVPTEFSTAAE